MNKKMFIFSDPHGFYDETIKCLKESGYDENNDEHLLVCLGDFTDRGSQSLELYEYLYRLTQDGKAIVLPGNHSKFLIEYLDGTTNNPFNYLNNGVDETFASLLGRTRPFESWCLIDNHIEEPTYGDFSNWLVQARAEINKQYPELLPWLKSLPRYFETEHYIMAHASIDTQAIDWREPHCIRHTLIDWDALDFDDGSFLGKRMLNTYGKTVVVGHFHTYHLRHKYNYSTVTNPASDEADHSILDINDETLGHKIFIDGCTPLTKKVNVLVIEDKLLEERKGGN